MLAQFTRDRKTTVTTITANPFDFIDALDVPLPVAVAASIATTAKTLAPPAAKPTTTNARTRSTPSRLPLYVDIETVPDESRMELFGLDPLPTPAVYLTENESTAPSEMLRGTIEDMKAAIVKTTASGKKLPRVVIEATIKMERAAQKPRKGVVDLFGDMLEAIDGEAAMIATAADAQRKTMSVTPEFCRIVAIGWATGSDIAQSMVVGQKSADGTKTLTEADLLFRFWVLAANAGAIVGYNVAGFDLPVLFVRSILLDISPTRKLDLKPWGSDVCDLMQQRFPKGPARKLKDLAKVMGIPVPAEGVDGSQVAELFAKDPARLGEYVRSDVQITRELHRKYKGFFT